MPITDTHEDYNTRTPGWQRIRDAIAGQDAVKGRTTAYLPMLGGMEPEDYSAYLARPVFYDAVSVTQLGLVGMVFRKDPTITLPSGLEAIGTNADMAGQSLAHYAKAIVGEVIAMGRVGILVDAPRDPGRPELARPFFATYAAEQIRNWRVEIRGGEPVLTQVILYERIAEIPGDGIGVRWVPQYRELLLGEMGYIVRLWRKDEQKGEWMVYDTFQPFARRARELGLTRIPFVFVGPTGLEAKPEKPPLLALVDMALSHFRSSADLESGRHWTSVPQAWFSGVPTAQLAGMKLRMGGGHAWALPKDGQAGLLEYTGQGLTSLENALKEKEAKMAVLGSRMLEDRQRGVEAAETVGRRQSGEHSLLASIADSVGRGIERALTFAAVDWLLLTPAEKAIAVALNKDFYPEPMDPAMLDKQFQLLQSGRMSWPQFVRNMQRGEIFDADKTADEIRAEIEDTSWGMEGAEFGAEGEGGDPGASPPADGAGRAAA